MGRRRDDDPTVAGLVEVDKPEGATSHDVVAGVRRALGVRRAGHSGTLDPAATGLLLVGVGWVTRVLRFTGAFDKTYVGEVTFGMATTTLDAQGEATATADMSALTRTEVEGALATFVGDQMQVPPMVSAIKVAGEKLYEKARRGEEITREPRPITIHDARVVDFTAARPSDAVPPTARIEVRCSAGTYIRVLAYDLGVALRGQAHLSALRRTRIGPHDVSDALPLADVGALGRAALRPAAEAAAGLPVVVAGAAAATEVSHGRPLQSLPSGSEGPVAVQDTEGRLVAIVEADAHGRGRPVCVAPPETLVASGA